MYETRSEDMDRFLPQKEKIDIDTIIDVSDLLQEAHLGMLDSQMLFYLFWQGLSQADTAKRLNVSKDFIFRRRKMIIKKLKPFMESLE